MKKLTQAQINTFKARKPVFLRAQEITGVPWQAVAAVWYRESFSVAPPRTPGGPFQFDPIPAPTVLMSLLDRFTKLSASEKISLVNAGVNDFQAGAVFAACWLRHKTGPVITPEASDDLIKDAFWGYNGRSYGSADQSPYVMNFYDEKHCGADGKGMIVVGTIPDGKGGRKSIRAANTQLGAFTVYKQLKEFGI